MEHQFEITGMTCSHCVARVKKALENVENIQTATIRLESPQAIISMDENVPIEQLKAAVQSAGDYEINKMS